MYIMYIYGGVCTEDDYPYVSSMDLFINMHGYM
jgi:hypothetical protein